MDYSHDMFYDYDLYGKPLLDYTPDLIPNEPSDEHHLDDLYMPPLTASSASPAPPSSYLQYLQNSNNEWMQQQPALDSSDLSYMLDPALFSNEWLLYDELPKNDPAHPPASSNNSNHAAASAAAAAAALDPASWLAQGPLEQMSALDAGGMTREYVSLSVSPPCSLLWAYKLKKIEETGCQLVCGTGRFPKAGGVRAPFLFDAGKPACAP